MMLVVLIGLDCFIYYMTHAVVDHGAHGSLGGANVVGIYCKKRLKFKFICVMSDATYEGRPINKFLNGIILLIFKI